MEQELGGETGIKIETDFEIPIFESFGYCRCYLFLSAFSID